MQKVYCDNKGYEEYLSVNVNGKDCSTPIKPLHYLIQDILNNKGKCPTSQAKPSTPNVDNNTESKPDSKPEGNTDSNSNKPSTPNVDNNTESKPDSKPEGNTDSNSNKPSTPNVDNNTESKPDSKPEGNTDSNQESKPEVKPDQPSNPSGNFASFQKKY
ncbi:hypothetical protein AAIB48_08790 [Paraclostridium benzoelyticum]|uniref:hypothetical protein n=1 Tax=Paraclostridium benzoelyticum TaxID=1629550 RepID=UPI0031CCFE74